MSINDFNAKALDAQLMMNQLISIDISWIKHMVLKLFQCLMKGMKLQRNKIEKQPSRTDDAISDDRCRLVGNLDGKRRSKPTKH